MSTRWRGSSHSASQGNVCVVLAYSAGGAALMNTWLYMVHARLLAYFLMTILWLSPAFLSMLRIRRTTSECKDALLAHVKADTGVSSIGWPIVLLITGSTLGLLIVVGSTVLLGVFAIGCTMIPWYRIRLCRERPVLASLIMCGGGAIVVAVYRHHVGFMFLPLAAWILGVAALSALLGATPKKLPGKQPDRADSVPAEP
ncbi:MAG: hypothetical protein ACJ8HJ_26470 [Massilia sp.]